MAATKDFAHDEEIIDAVIDVLEAQLPATWRTGGDTLLRLQRIDFGDFETYQLPKGKEIEDLCPSIFVWADRSENATETYGGVGGKEGQVVPVRVLHFWRRDQCQDIATPANWVQPARAQAQRSKVISKALWNDRRVGLAGEDTLTTSDTGARVIEARPGVITYGNLKGGTIITVAIDFEVATRTH